MMRKTLAAAVLVAAAALLSACGADDSGEGSGDASFNEADVAFATDMIPHHQQAVEMAEMAADRAESSEVKDLAADIEAAQGPEIDQLTRWLEDWGQDVPSAPMDHGDMGHDDSDAMAGMMDEEEMTMLEEAEGDSFDRMFLEMMIEHHEGAVEMAQDEVGDGRHDGAIAMAKEIIETQEGEIDQMAQLLAA